MLKIRSGIVIQEDEIEISHIRAQGAGGQNVNKVSSVAHLRFDIRASSLPVDYKDKLLTLSDGRITKDGVIIIKAQQFRTQEKNRQDALLRLQQLIQQTTEPQRKHHATKPTLASKKRRVEGKKHRATIKNLRGQVRE